MATYEKKMLKRKILNEKYERALENNKTIYIGGITGLGKTASVREWLSSKGKAYSYASAKDEDFLSKIIQCGFRNNEIIVLDDLHVLQDENEQLSVFDYIQKTKSRFVLIGRMTLPGWLKTLFAARQMVLFDHNDLVFSKEEIEDFYQENDIEITKKQLDQIYEDTHGIALVVLMVERHLHHEGYSDRVFQKAKQDVFDCLDFSFFRSLNENEKSFVLSLAAADQFNPRIVTLITGEKDAEKVAQKLVYFEDIFVKTSADIYTHVSPEFREYLLQKQRTKMPEESIYEICRTIGQYYEEKGDIRSAIPYYVKSKDSEKVSELLIENTRRHTSDAMFHDTEQYYNSLPEEYILKSPELMCGMSMMQSVCLRPEESEKWYRRLKEFARTIDKKDERYEVAKEKLLYLDIGLPHRGAGNLADIFCKIAGMISPSNRISMQDISVSGNLPSLMNGGKDFCHWSRKDRIMYKTMRKPVELVLGKSGIGLADVGLAESLYEKNEDLNFTEPLEYLNKSLSRIMTEGTVQMQFAATGVMTRVFLASGSIENSIKTLNGFSEKMGKIPHHTLQPNIKAHRALLSLYEGDYDAVLKWQAEDSPDELAQFNIQKKYRYLVKARVYILQGKYTEAISLLNRLKVYYQNYGRPYGEIQSLLLAAIAHYRMNDARWSVELNEALLRCEGYRFTRIVADEGMAILNSLVHLEYTGNISFYRTVLYLTRKHSENYPLYMGAIPDSEVHLTTVEKKVLKLISQRIANEKIAEILDISVRTVKYHTGNIFTKLKVKNRAQAIMAAIENNLV